MRVIATKAAGMLIDAFVVRTLLVPALVSLMGRWNWWMPSPVGKLLRVPQPLAVQPAESGPVLEEALTTAP